MDLLSTYFQFPCKNINKIKTQIFLRNLNRAGSRYKGTDGTLSSKSGDAAGGFDEDHQIDMTMFTDKKDRVTDLKKWEIERQEKVNELKGMKKVESRCWWWLGSSNFSEELLIYSSENLSVIKTPGSKSIVRGQVYIVPVKHSSSFVECSIEVWEELNVIKKSLNKLWKSQGTISLGAKRRAMNYSALSSAALVYSFYHVTRASSLPLSSLRNSNAVYTNRASSRFDHLRQKMYLPRNSPPKKRRDIPNEN